MSEAEKGDLRRAEARIVELEERLAAVEAVLRAIIGETEGDDPLEAAHVSFVKRVKERRR